MTIPCPSTNYETQVFKVVNTHHYSHFKKLQDIEGMDSYRKNKNPFDYSKENRLSLSRKEYVAPKIGSEGPKQVLKGKCH